MSNFPTKLTDIILPHQHNRDGEEGSGSVSIYKTIASLRKSTLSIPNRLSSVLQDAAFVEALYKYLNGFVSAEGQIWPLIPNERSGSWPLDPELKQRSQVRYTNDADNEALVKRPVSAYFKSTDGHINQWSFSTRRLNIPVLEMLGVAGRAILIDTTRRGKAFPDALRRTVPIWCAVWNQVLFPEQAESLTCRFKGLNLSDSETAQIEARIPQFLTDLKNLNLDLPTLRKSLTGPIRCVWVKQPQSFQDWDSTFDELKHEILHERTNSLEQVANGSCSILVCVSASRQVLGAEMSEEGYIQGAGDDSEGWSHGLTASVFWEHRHQLLDEINSSSDIEQYVTELVRDSKKKITAEKPILIGPTSNLFLGWEGDCLHTPFLLVDCSQTSRSPDNPQKPTSILRLECKEGKPGSKQLRDKLAIVHSATTKALRDDRGTSIYVRCATGKDLSVGVILMLLCSFYDGEGIMDINARPTSDKELVRKRLAWVISAKPDANPSRATLQAVNSFLMARPI